LKSVLRWLVSNFPLMIMALVLATLAWFVALEEGDPTLEERYSQAIPITPVALPEDKLIIERSAESVHVTVRAPQSIWENLRVSDFNAVVNLAGLSPGEHQVPVQVDLEKEPSRIVSFEPQSVTFRVDAESKRSVPVHVQVEGEPALGYLRRSVVLDVREVTVKGPTSYVTKVVEAFAAISVNNADADVEQELQLEPRDAEGQPVSNVSMTPEVVSVRVPIEPSGYYRPLAVKVILEGEVALDYRVTDISVDPPTVTVFGAPDVLTALQGFIETEAIDVEGAQEDVSVRPALNVPENVAVVRGQQVEVRVFIEAIESSLTMEIAPGVQGLEPGLTTTLSPETVEVILGGPLPMLEALDAENVRVVLDLFELSLGTHQIEPQVIVPEGVIARSIIPATVQVEISVATTPTATVQQPITATATMTTTSE
jgi:YbbR domain-containing protein